MKRHKKYLPYVRRGNGQETAESLREAMRIAYYQVLEKPYYVMVQHGFPNNVIAIGASKREVKRSVLMVNVKRMKFKEWAKTIQKAARK